MWGFNDNTENLCTDVLLLFISVMLLFWQFWVFANKDIFINTYISTVAVEVYSFKRYSVLVKSFYILWAIIVIIITANNSKYGNRCSSSNIINWSSNTVDEL